MMRAHAGAINHHHVDVVRVGDGLHDPVPVACIAPPVEAVVDRGRWAVLLWQIGPRDAGAKDVENTVDHAAVINTLLAPCLVGQDRIDELPFKIAHV